MEDLIKRSDAIKVAENLLVRIDIKYQTDIEYGNNQGLINAIAGINELPSADRPQGEWIDAKNAGWKCTVCGKWSNGQYDYCPNCGARMKGAE